MWKQLGNVYCIYTVRFRNDKKDALRTKMNIWDTTNMWHEVKSKPYFLSHFDYDSIRRAILFRWFFLLCRSSTLTNLTNCLSSFRELILLFKVNSVSSEQTGLWYVTPGSLCGGFKCFGPGTSCLYREQAKTGGTGKQPPDRSPDLIWSRTWNPSSHKMHKITSEDLPQKTAT